MSFSHTGFHTDWPTNVDLMPPPRERTPIQPEELRIAVIGGGTGSSVVLRGLKQHTSQLTAIVTMFDSGGSSGRLRQEFGYPSFGDLRQCLMALSEESDSECPATIHSLLGFRFARESSLCGHNLGNLFLAALTSLHDLEEAIDRLSHILRIRGRVAPVSLDQADVYAELEDGSFLKGEARIDLRGWPLPRIRRVFLDSEVEANPRAVQAILEADAVVLGPGDLYTSLVPNLLVKGIPEALRQTRATLIYVCNLMTKRGETDGFKASDFVAEVNRYLGDRLIEWTVVNTAPMRPEIQRQYEHQGARPVEADVERLARQGSKYLAAPLANSLMPVRHDPALLAEAILSLPDLSWITRSARHNQALRVPV